jgi:hypothetical protein
MIAKRKKSPGTNRSSQYSTVEHSPTNPASSSPQAFIAASIRAQRDRVTEAPRRAAILDAIRRALHGEELGDYDLDFDDPFVVQEFRHALVDVRCELDCDGRIPRAAAAILTQHRIRGKASR